MHTNRTGVILCGLKVLCLKKDERMWVLCELDVFLFTYFMSFVLNSAAASLLKTDQTQSGLLFHLSPRSKTRTLHVLLNLWCSPGRRSDSWGHWLGVRCLIFSVKPLLGKDMVCSTPGLWYYVVPWRGVSPGMHCGPAGELHKNDRERLLVFWLLFCREHKTLLRARM